MELLFANISPIYNNKTYFLESQKKLDFTPKIFVQKENSFLKTKEQKYQSDSLTFLDKKKKVNRNKFENDGESFLSEKICFKRNKKIFKNLKSKKTSLLNFKRKKSLSIDFENLENLLLKKNQNIEKEILDFNLSLCNNKNNSILSEF